MREQRNNQLGRTSASQTALWIAIGIAIGAAIGVMMDNLAIGLAIGLIFGIALDAIRRQERQKTERNDEQAGSDT